jgi:hypothetical protein
VDGLSVFQVIVAPLNVTWEAAGAEIAGGFLSFPESCPAALKAAPASASVETAAKKNKRKRRRTARDPARGRSIERGVFCFCMAFFPVLVALLAQEPGVQFRMGGRPPAFILLSVQTGR